jgi:hypothetical protein
MRIFNARSGFTSLGLLLIGSTQGLAGPVTTMQVHQAVRTWLQQTPTPLQTPMPETIAGIETHTDTDGRVLFHEVKLDPGGFVIVAPDDLLEPVIAFAPSGSLDKNPESHLYLLLQKDLRARLAQIVGTASGKGPRIKAASTLAPHAKWAQLMGTTNLSLLPPQTTIEDVRVSPLVQSLWDQAKVGSNYVYNYFTPNHYVCGCVATAMAQLMRFHQFPTSGIGVKPFKVGVGTASQTLSTRGGDGQGGAYAWSSMPLIIGAGSSDAQRQQVGALCYDAGLAVNMHYDTNANGGSGATMYSATKALRTTFQYANAILGVTGGELTGHGLTEMVQPNLDAGYPVLFGISGTEGGHAIVCDGYGYSSGTLFHHLNMGWSGYDNAWYNLPNIATTSYTFNLIDDCVYNVFPSGTGQILSGRITDGAGSPVSGVTVSNGTVSALSGTNGIFALKGIASGVTTITATKTGATYPQAVRIAGTSQDGPNVGNVWGVDLVQGGGATPQVLPQPISQSVKLGGSVTFTAGATGTGPLHFAWTKNGVSVGTDSPIYTLANAADSDDQAPIVVHVNGGQGGSADSSPATLSVLHLFNGDFELGRTAWTLLNPGDGTTPNGNVVLGPTDYPEVAPHGGNNWLCIGDWSSSCTDSASQDFIVPDASSVDLSFWVGIANKTSTPASVSNIFKVKITDTNDNVLATLQTLDNTNAQVDGSSKVVWKQYGPFSLTAWKGQNVRLRLESYQPGGSNTGTVFAVDDIALAVTRGPKATIAPGPLTLVTGSTANFTATVSGFTSDNRVDWSVDAGAGSFNPTRTAGDGAATTVFSAASTPGSFTVKATPVEANGNAASTPVVLVAPASVNIGLTPSASVVKLGQAIALTASVTPLTDRSVVWSSNGGSFGSQDITTASWSSASAGTYTITATSHGAPARATSVQVQVVDTSAIVLTLDHPNLTMLPGTSAPFTASGDQGFGVTWTLTGSAGATKVDNGLQTTVTVPSAAPTANQTYTLKAASTLDSTRFGAATITVKSMDLDASGVIDVRDLLVMAKEWGQGPGAASNLKGSGTVDTTDLDALLGKL